MFKIYSNVAITLDRRKHYNSILDFSFYETKKVLADKCSILSHFFLKYLSHVLLCKKM
jgi:hypothetical protein